MVTSIIEHPAEVSEPRTSASAPVTDVAFRPRHISFKAARALEILGHAIEYLSDASCRDVSSGQENHAHLEPLQILMSLNHKIYFACPPARPLRERLRSFLHLHRG